MDTVLSTSLPPFPFLSIRVRNTYKPTQTFIHNILHTEYRAATDVYALMFLTDVVDFIVIVFGFWAFGVSMTVLTDHINRNTRTSQELQLVNC